MVPGRIWNEGVGTEACVFGDSLIRAQGCELLTCPPQTRAPAHGLFMRGCINRINILIINNDTLITAVVASPLTHVLSLMPAL